VAAVVLHVVKVSFMRPLLNLPLDRYEGTFSDTPT
jgi:hypothetical protein